MAVSWEKSWELRARGLLDYFDRLAVESAEAGALFTKSAVDNSWRCWHQVSRKFEETFGLKLQVPNACPGDNDNVLLSWDDGKLHVECEVFGDGRVEFFKSDRSTEAFDGVDAEIDDPIAKQVLDWLTHFAR